MTEIPKYPAQPADAKKIEDPVARSMARPDACAKPGTVGGKVRVRTTLAAKAPKRGRSKGKRDPRDIKYF